MKKKLIAIILSVCMVIAFTACGKSVSEEDVIGSWVGLWTYNGNNIGAVVEIKSDHTYSFIDCVGDTSNITTIQGGTWELNGSKLITTCETVALGNAAVGSKMTYNVDPDSNTLENGGHTFNKSSN